MRILYLCHRAPYPPDKGDRLRAFHHLRHLSRRHHVHLVTLADDPQVAQRAAPLRDLCAAAEVFPRSAFATAPRLVLGLAGRAPLTHAHFTSRPLRRRLAALARSQRFHVVVAYCSSMAPYASLFAPTPALLDLVDVDSAKWAQYARVARWPRSRLYTLEARRLRAYESGLHRLFERVTVTTRRELELLGRICPAVQAAVVRNGIDLDYFGARLPRRSTQPALVFTGQMDYLPNVDGVTWFAHRVLPKIRESLPEVRFVVVGRSPTATVRALARLPGVEITGEVEDVRPHLAAASIFVAPLRIARGVQNKVLEAMASGLPVVCTSQVLSGLTDGGLRDGEHLLAADGAAALAAAALRLLREEPLQRRLAAASRGRIESAYSWNRNNDELEALLEHIGGTGWAPRAVEARGADGPRLAAGAGSP